MTKEFESGIQLKIPEELTRDRYVEPSGISKAEAKKICEDNGVVWAVE